MTLARVVQASVCERFGIRLEMRMFNYYNGSNLKK